MTSFKLIKESARHTTIKIPYSIISKHKTLELATSTRSLSYQDFFIETVKKEITALVEKSVSKEKEPQDLEARDRCALFAGYFNNPTLLTH